MEQLDILSEANKEMMRAQQFLSDNKKTLDKAKKREIKDKIAAVQKAVRFKKPEKLTDEDIENIKTQVEQLKKCCNL